MALDALATVTKETAKEDAAMAIVDQLLNDLKSKPKPADNSPPVADAPNSSANAEAVRGLDTTFNPWETNKQASNTSTKTSETDATPQLPQVVPQAATPQAQPVTPQVFQTRTDQRRWLSYSRDAAPAENSTTRTPEIPVAVLLLVGGGLFYYAMMQLVAEK